jgi:hypothetical protein
MTESRKLVCGALSANVKIAASKMVRKIVVKQ